MLPEYYVSSSSCVSFDFFWVHVLIMPRQEYIVRDNEVLIVDTFSGRVLEGRRYSDGLHQCIEAKEGGRVRAWLL